MLDVFSDRALVAAMLAFEAALADAEAAEGVVPKDAAVAIVAATRAEVDVGALVAAARSAGSVAIPLVKTLTAAATTRSPA